VVTIYGMRKTATHWLTDEKLWTERSLCTCTTDDHQVCKMSQLVHSHSWPNTTKLSKNVVIIYTFLLIDKNYQIK